MQNGIQRRAVLSTLLLNFALEYPIRKAQENHVGLKLNGTHKLLPYVDDVNLLGNNTDTVKKNTETLTYSSKVSCLEINIETTMYMPLSHHQNACQNCGVKTGNSVFEKFATIQIFGNNTKKSKFDSGGN
jgi:hypothetical protein